MRTNLIWLLAFVIFLSCMYYTVTSDAIEVGGHIDWHEGVVK